MSKKWNGKVRVVYDNVRELYLVQSRTSLQKEWTTVFYSYDKDWTLMEADKVSRSITGANLKVIQE